jgi:hypothetical protein
MKAFVHFDASVGPYDIQSNLSIVRSIPGVKSVDLLRRTAGEAAMYCLEIEADDSAVKDLGGQMDGVASQFAGYISNIKLTVYAKA